MNESKSNVPNMYQTIPAVAALNRVPGFEPMKLLRPARSRKSNEKVMKLALPYKKLWFRLAHPKGRIKINCLKLTEQMAIYEAQVYLDHSDTEPISNFTASCIFDNTVKNDYIRDAQEEAINEALSIAGFDSQFADVEMTKEEERFGSEITLSAIPHEKPIVKAVASTIQKSLQKEVTPASVVEPTKPVMKVSESVEDKLPIEAEESELPVPPTQNIPQEKKSEVAVEQMQPILSVQDNLSAAQRAMQILQRKPDVGNVTSVAQTAEIKLEQTEITEPAKYTRNTPVPEILKLMTFEEAQKVVVDMGTCKGKTMQEVAETRPASLKFYLFGGYKEGNNILLAAARIMYDYLESQKMEKAG